MKRYYILSNGNLFRFHIQIIWQNAIQWHKIFTCASNNSFNYGIQIQSRREELIKSMLNMKEIY